MALKTAEDMGPNIAKPRGSHIPDPFRGVTAVEAMADLMYAGTSFDNVRRIANVDGYIDSEDLFKLTNTHGTCNNSLYKNELECLNAQEGWMPRNMNKQGLGLTGMVYDETHGLEGTCVTNGVDRTVHPDIEIDHSITTQSSCESAGYHWYLKIPNSIWGPRVGADPETDNFLVDPIIRRMVGIADNAPADITTKAGRDFYIQRSGMDCGDGSSDFTIEKWDDYIEYYDNTFPNKPKLNASQQTRINTYNNQTE